MLPSFTPTHLEHPLIWPKTVEFRLYQKKIAEAASDRNTLVILPTALGKTIISVLVAADTLYHYRDVKVLIMAPTRPLVMQHRNSFMKLLKLGENDTVLLTGTTSPEYRRAGWEGNARVIFATPQVVRNDLLAGRLSLERYGLLVFDECHRAVKEYAYTDIAQCYMAQAHYPLILGMTASPGSDLNRVLEVCRNLRVEKVEYRSEDDPDVKSYIQPIELEWKMVDLPHEYLELLSCIKSMLNKRLNWLYNAGVIRVKAEYVTRKRLIEAGSELRYTLEKSLKEEQGKIFAAIMNQSLALTLFHMRELLETQGWWTLKAFLAKVEQEKTEKRSYRVLVNDTEYKTLRNRLDTHLLDHPKLDVMKTIVGDQIKRKFSSRMLIFTQYRDTASHLVSELNTVLGVKAARFVGQASKLTDKGLTQEEQAERIKQLEDGELNVLVATSIAEEGLDIPAVDHVIFYEPIPSEIRYIQRRGRTGRKSPGKVTILATSDSLDMIYLYASKRKTEKMRRIIEGVTSKLQPVLRLSPKPPPNPVTPTELKTIEEEAQRGQIESGTLQTESEVLKEHRRNVNRTSRKLYLKLLERGGSSASFDQLVSDLEVGASQAMVKSAVERLVKDKLATETDPGRYTATSAVKTTGTIYEITIEKIMPGVAIVIVDDKWRARLMPEDYNGPRSLIKKNSKFKAVAELYRLNGTLCVKVKAVTEIL